MQAAEPVQHHLLRQHAQNADVRGDLVQLTDEAEAFRSARRNGSRSPDKARSKRSRASACRPSRAKAMPDALDGGANRTSAGDTCRLSLGGGTTVNCETVTEGWRLRQGAGDDRPEPRLRSSGH